MPIRMASGHGSDRTSAPSLLEIAQIVGNIDVVGHRIISFPTSPISLHHVGQDFAEYCDSIGVFAGHVSYLFGSRVKQALRLFL
jgi:hypothetical protein